MSGATAIRRLGIVRLSAIGDVVHALPLAHGLRDAHPKARIHWIVQEEAAPLLRDHPAVDEVVVFPRRGGAGAWLDFAKRLRACKLDATVDPQGNAKSGLVALLSGARLRAGLHPADCKEAVNALATNRRGRRACGPHGVDRAWAAGEPLGVRPGPDRWGLRATEAERAAWRARCRVAGADPDGRMLALHLTDPDDARAWPAESWAALAVRAASRGFQVVLNGTSPRAPLARKVARLAGAPVFDLVGRDDLRGFLAQLEDMTRDPRNALVSPDSGPVHLAVAVGLPVVCLSGPQDPARTGPRGGGVAVHAWEGLSCAPCLERKCVRRPPDRRCMRDLSPDAVWAAIEASAARGGPGRSRSGGRAPGPRPTPAGPARRGAPSA